MSPRKALAANLRAYMETKRVTQMALAARSGVSQSTVARILKGAVAVDLDTLEQVAKGMELHSWQLLVPDMNPLKPPALADRDAQERELIEKLKKALLAE